MAERALEVQRAPTGGPRIVQHFHGHLLPAHFPEHEARQRA
jgi:hypothetical protein